MITFVLRWFDGSNGVLPPVTAVPESRLYETWRYAGYPGAAAHRRAGAWIPYGTRY